MKLDKYTKRRLVCTVYPTCEGCPFRSANHGECLDPIKEVNTEKAFKAAKRLKEEQGLIWLVFKVNDDPYWNIDVFNSNSVALIGQRLVALKQFYGELKVTIL